MLTAVLDKCICESLFSNFSLLNYLLTLKLDIENYKL